MLKDHELPLADVLQAKAGLMQLQMLNKKAHNFNPCAGLRNQGNG